jgi:hypothetical protein
MQNATLNNNASVLSLNPKSVKNATSAHALTIAAYGMSFRKGMLIVLGMYSDAIIDIIDHPSSSSFSYHLLMARQFRQ